MIEFDAVLVAVAHVSRRDLTVWIERRWVRPQHEPGGYRFTDMDVARVALIRDLRDDLALDEEAVPVVLSLLDQVYGLRHRLRWLGAAIAAQPPEVQEAIRDALRRLQEEPGGCP